MEEVALNTKEDMIVITRDGDAAFIHKLTADFKSGSFFFERLTEYVAAQNYKTLRVEKGHIDNYSVYAIIGDKSELVHFKLKHMGDA